MSKFVIPLVVGLILAGVSGFVLPLITGLVVYSMNANQDQTQDATVNLAGVTQQITGLINTITELRAEVRGLKTQMDTARVDPFTGTMGDDMKESLTMKIEREARHAEEERDDLAARIRAVEKEVPERGP